MLLQLLLKGARPSKQPIVISRSLTPRQPAQGRAYVESCV